MLKDFPLSMHLWRAMYRQVMYRTSMKWMQIDRVFSIYDLSYVKQLDRFRYPRERQLLMECGLSLSIIAVSFAQFQMWFQI